MHNSHSLYDVMEMGMCSVIGGGVHMQPFPSERTDPLNEPGSSIYRNESPVSAIETP